MHVSTSSLRVGEGEQAMPFFLFNMSSQVHASEEAPQDLRIHLNPVVEWYPCTPSNPNPKKCTIKAKVLQLEKDTALSGYSVDHNMHQAMRNTALVRSCSHDSRPNQGRS